MGKLLSDFEPREVPQPENMHFHFMRFPIGALPEVQNWFWKHFSHKVLYNYYSKKKIGAFWPIFNKVKKLYPIVFSNLAGKGSRGFIQARKLIILPNGL